MLRFSPMATLLLCALPSLAARPFDTDDDGTVAVAATELELGGEGDASSGGLKIGLKHGLTPSLDLGLSMGHATWPDTARTWEGAVVGFKLNLVPNLFSFAFANEVGTSFYTVNAIGCWQKDATGIHLNLGGEFSAGQREETFTWGVNPHRELGPFTVGLELTGTDAGPSLWRLGTQLHASPRVGLDTGFGRDLEGRKAWIGRLGMWVALSGP